jgi:hypothetical protein
MMACASPRVIATSTGAVVCGSKWRVMMRRSGSPMVRAASTNSCSLVEITTARTKRATSIHWVHPIMRHTATMEILGATMLDKNKITKNTGTASIRSTARMSSVSIHPP